MIVTVVDDTFPASKVNVVPLPKTRTGFVALFLFCFICRSTGSVTTLQSQVQNLHENLGKVTVERDVLKKELEAKTLDIQEKLKTITQVKKLGRRYKTQYEELKVEHDKVKFLYLFRGCCLRIH